MTAPVQLLGTSNRIEAVDALRGFALWGILVVHMLEQYYAGGLPQAHAHYAVGNMPDPIFMGFADVLIRSKFFAIFSFLFGLSFFLQMDSAAQKGVNFLGRFIWRLVLLLIIGTIHHLFYRGDILNVFALLGFFLVLFFLAPNSIVLGFSAFLLLGGPRFLIFAWRSYYGFPPDDQAAQEAAETIYYETVKHGSLLDVFWINFSKGLQTKFFFQFDLPSRGYISMGLFLLGMYFGRIRFFEHLADYKKTMRIILIATFPVIFALGGLLFLILGKDVKFPSIQAMIGWTFGDLVNNFFATFIVSGFLMIFMTKKGGTFLGQLAPYGKMALTNYFMQSVIGTFIFFGWGLGKLGDFGASIAFLIANVVFIAQLYFSKFWLSKYQYGPLEWLWRSGTYLRWAPLAVVPKVHVEVPAE